MMDGSSVKKKMARIPLSPLYLFLLYVYPFHLSIDFSLRFTVFLSLYTYTNTVLLPSTAPSQHTEIKNKLRFQCESLHFFHPCMNHYV